MSSMARSAGRDVFRSIGQSFAMDPQLIFREFLRMTIPAANQFELRLMGNVLDVLVAVLTVQPAMGTLGKYGCIEPWLHVGMAHQAIFVGKRVCRWPKKPKATKNHNEQHWFWTH